MRNSLAAILIGTWLGAAAGASAQSINKAELLIEQGLTADAQRELVNVVCDSTDPAARARALNTLASLAIDQNNIRAAVSSWARLIHDYPTSAEAVRAKDRFPLLASVIGKVPEEPVGDPAARLYLRIGDFWTGDREKVFSIDASSIDGSAAAMYWYDRVIAEFPGTAPARIAFEDKMRALLSSPDSGSKPGADGLSPLESTFRDYERAFPAAGSAQAFRFQIAQSFWKQKSWDKARDWLKDIVARDAGVNSFYRDLADRRLEKLE